MINEKELKIKSKTNLSEKKSAELIEVKREKKWNSDKIGRKKKVESTCRMAETVSMFVPRVPVILPTFHASPWRSWTEFRAQHATLSPVEAEKVDAQILIKWSDGKKNETRWEMEWSGNKM